MEDVVVSVPGPSAPGHRPWVHGADTPAVIRRRRGGSAATVAVAAARIGVRSRFIGQVGDDPLGDALVAELIGSGVEVVGPRRGRTGTVVVVVDADGERSMLTDRGASVALEQIEPAWLEGLAWLHLPLYSLAVDPLAAAVTSLARQAQREEIAVSVDLSSVTVLDQLGPAAIETVRRLAPAVVFANRDEAAWIGLPDLGALAPVVVEKRGQGGAVLHRRGGAPIEVAAQAVGAVADTTGAGDTFAAGFLAARVRGADDAAATVAGHRCAADHLRALASTST